MTVVVFEETSHAVQMYSCGRCGTALAGQVNVEIHRAYHDNLEAWRQDLQTILLGLNERCPDAAIVMTCPDCREVGCDQDCKEH